MRRILLYVSLLTLIACGNSVEFKEDSRDLISEDFPLTQLNFETINREIIQKSCIDCHKAYEDYETVFNARKEIRNSILQNRMPKKAPALSVELKTMIATWVGIGAPKGDTSGDSGTKGLEPTWASLSLNIFFPKCVQCHNPGGVASYVDLSTRQKFFEQRDYLLNNFEDIEDSYLFQILNDTENPMPPLDSGIDLLSEKEKSVIKKWIERGLP